jgi:L-alanine-DL-glutamate epimerase-like enolase superfamily enzyme
LGAGWWDGSNQCSFRSREIEAWVDLEVEKLSRVRSQVGPDFAIALDAHMGNVAEGWIRWDVGMATAIARALEQFGLLFLEEPLNNNDYAGYRSLCAATNVPIATGECLTSVNEFLPWSQNGSLDVVQPDAGMTGMAAMVEICSLFAVNGHQVAPHAWGGGGVVMQNLHAAFASPGVLIHELPPLPGELHTEIWSEGMRFRDGWLLPPESPGLGICLSEELKNRYPFVPGSGEWNKVQGKDHYYTFPPGRAPLPVSSCQK